MAMSTKCHVPKKNRITIKTTTRTFSAVRGREGLGSVVVSGKKELRKRIRDNFNFKLFDADLS